jgi:Spy/CpxP family protein refolding chaperone
MSTSKNIHRTAVAAGCALVVAVTVTTGPAQAQAKRPDLGGRVDHAAHAAWDGEQNMAKRHEQMTVAWRLGLGG